MDGYEATQLIKADEETKNIPIIALTASAMKQAEDDISKICEDFLKKPVGKAELVSKLTEFLESDVAQREAPELTTATESDIEVTEEAVFDSETLEKLP